MGPRVGPIVGPGLRLGPGLGMGRHPVCTGSTEGITTSSRASHITLKHTTAFINLLLLIKAEIILDRLYSDQQEHKLLLNGIADPLR